MALTDVAIREAKAKDKPYKLGDADGLFLPSKLPLPVLYPPVLYLFVASGHLFRD